MLVVLSPDSANSDEVVSEWRAALEQEMPVIPLVIKECDVPRRLRVIEYIDFTDRGPGDESAVKEVVVALQEG